MAATLMAEQLIKLHYELFILGHFEACTVLAQFMFDQREVGDNKVKIGVRSGDGMAIADRLIRCYPDTRDTVRRMMYGQ